MLFTPLVAGSCASGPKDLLSYVLTMDLFVINLSFILKDALEIWMLPKKASSSHKEQK